MKHRVLYLIAIVVLLGASFTPGSVKAQTTTIQYVVQPYEHSAPLPTNTAPPGRKFII